MDPLRLLGLKDKQATFWPGKWNGTVSTILLQWQFLYFRCKCNEIMLWGSGGNTAGWAGARCSQSQVWKRTPISCLLAKCHTGQWRAASRISSWPSTAAEIMVQAHTTNQKLVQACGISHHCSGESPVREQSHASTWCSGCKQLTPFHICLQDKTSLRPTSISPMFTSKTPTTLFSLQVHPQHLGYFLNSWTAASRWLSPNCSCPHAAVSEAVPQWQCFSPTHDSEAKPTACTPPSGRWPEHCHASWHVPPC